MALVCAHCISIGIVDTLPSMFVRELGADGDAVLLLHGTPSPAADWMPLAEQLGSRFRVLIPELPGYGRSPALADSAVESVGDALAAMLRERNITELTAVVGFSTGVYRSFDLLSRHRIPTRVVVALAGMVHFDDDARAMRRGFAEQLEADPAFLDSEAARSAMRDLMLSERWRASQPADVRRVTEWLRTTTASALAAELRGLADARDLRTELRTFASPVVARVGDADVGAPLAWSQQIVDAVPSGSLEVVRGAGHALLIEDAQATREAVVRHVESHGTHRAR